TFQPVSFKQVGDPASKPKVESNRRRHSPEVCDFQTFMQRFYSPFSNDIMKFAGKRMELENVILSEKMELKDLMSSDKIVFTVTATTLALQEPTKRNLGQPY
ncbi:hypothetical protein STEG23_022332, partial [Scotinomys teguina]